MTQLVRVDPPHWQPLASAIAAAAASVDLYAAVLSGRNARTARAYLSDFADFARFVGASTPAAALEALTALPPGTANACALAYRTHLTERKLAPATVSRRLAALRSAVKVAKTLGRVDWTLEVEAPSVQTYRDTAGPGSAGWRAMLDRAKVEATTPKGLRDLALIRLMHDLALRRGEAVALDLADLDLEGGAVAVVGKGRTQAVRMTLPEPARRALAGWVEARGSDPGPLFVRLDRAGAGSGRLTGRAVHKLVLALGRRSGLARPTRPHGLRHEGITKALDVSGGDVRSVQKFSRHRKLDVLLVYDDNRRDVAGEMARMVSED